MKKYDFSKKDKKEEQEILNYIRGLMEDNNKLRTDAVAFIGRNAELEDELMKAKKIDSRRINEINKWHSAYEQSEAEIIMWRQQYEEANKDAENWKQKLEILKLQKEALSKEVSILKEQFSVSSASVMKQVAATWHTTDDVSRTSSDVEEYKKKEKSLEDKIKKLQDKLGNESVPLSVLAEGLKDYAEEAGISEAHTLFNHLNNLLNSVPAWMKNVPQLKRFFREYNKKMTERVQAAGDFVMNKVVQNEVNGVASGAVGINIDKG